MAKYMKPKRKSLVAGIISFVGSLIFVWGLYHLLSAVYTIITTDDSAAGQIILGILIVILCFVIQYAAIMYDKYREHLKWKKRIKNAGIEEELAENDDLCWQAYRSNPTPFCIKYIEEINPKVAEDIKAYVAENSTTFIDKITFRSPGADGVKVKINDKPKEKKVVIETEQNWEDGETIIR